MNLMICEGGHFSQQETLQQRSLCVDTGGKKNQAEFNDTISQSV